MTTTTKRRIIRYLVILTTLILMALVSRQLRAEPLDQILSRVARTQDVPEKLLTAICQTESNMNLQAFTWEDGGPENHAFGACQILLTTAKSLGFADTGNRCRDYNTKQKAEYAVCGLFGPVTNFHLAAKYIKYQLKRYGGNWTSAIAAYNAGEVRFCPNDGRNVNRRGKVLSRCQKGEYVNQEYVNKVLAELERSKKIPQKIWDDIEECKQRLIQGKKCDDKPTNK